VKIKSDKQHSSRLPLWLKLSYTLFVVLLASVYLMEYGIENFLWGSDIALLVTVFGLWLENRFLVSMMIIGILLPEFFWNIDFFSRLVAGYDVFGLNLTAYMFDPNRLFLLRFLSLFHVFLPIVLFYAVLRLGYDSRAFLAQCLLTWFILPVSYFFTDPERNINGVFGLTAEPQTMMSGGAYLLLIMLLYPLLLSLPTHLALNYFLKTKNKQQIANNSDSKQDSIS
jgi:hypothetical protein